MSDRDTTRVRGAPEAAFRTIGPARGNDPSEDLSAASPEVGRADDGNDPTRGTVPETTVESNER